MKNNRFLIPPVAGAAALALGSALAIGAEALADGSGFPAPTTPMGQSVSPSNPPFQKMPPGASGVPSQIHAGPMTTNEAQRRDQFGRRDVRDVVVIGGRQMRADSLIGQNVTTPEHQWVGQVVALDRADSRDHVVIHVGNKQVPAPGDKRLIAVPPESLSAATEGSGLVLAPNEIGEARRP